MLLITQSELEDLCEKNKSFDCQQTVQYLRFLQGKLLGRSGTKIFANRRGEVNIKGQRAERELPVRMEGGKGGVGSELRCRRGRTTGAWWTIHRQCDE